MSSHSADAVSSEEETEMLPDERDVIAERVSDLDKMDAEEFLSVDELREELESEQ